MPQEEEEIAALEDDEEDSLEVDSSRGSAAATLESELRRGRARLSAHNKGEGVAVLYMWRGAARERAKRRSGTWASAALPPRLRGYPFRLPRRTRLVPARLHRLLRLHAGKVLVQRAERICGRGERHH